MSVSALGAQALLPSTTASISANGLFVAFQADSDNLIPNDTNGTTDIFVHDIQTGELDRVSLGPFGVQSDDWSSSASISADGRFVAFRSQATTLVFGDTNWFIDIFVHDRQTGVTERVSVDSFGIQGDEESVVPSISDDGRYVAFASEATNLVPWDTNDNGDMFVHDRQTGVTERVNVTSLGVEGNEECFVASTSADGRYVAFDSRATNLVPGDVNTKWDIFIHDRWDGLGENSIVLTGPVTSPVLTPVTFSWQTTRGNSRYWLAYSQNLNGAMIGGHNFDIGNPTTILATGNNAINGAGTFTSQPVPSAAAGLTIYFELAARDGAGVLFDSNVHAVTFN